MPVVRFQAGDTVMGRWPGSNLYYEVKVLSHSPKSQLYTVVYKDGTELELKDADIKSVTGFRQGSVRSRSRSRSRSPARTRRSRSRSPARTSRRSSSHTTETRRDKLKDVLEVRLTPVTRRGSGAYPGITEHKTMPLVNNSSNEHEKKEENDTANKVVEVKEETENQVSGRYNLRRRREPGEERPFELKDAEPVVFLATPQQTSKTTDLEFGGRIGVFFLLLLLPVVVLALLILCGQKDSSLLSFPRMLPTLDSLWDWQVFGITLLWLLFQAVLSLLPIGKVVNGMPLKNGKTLKYRINGFYALLVSAVAVGAGVYNGVDLGYIHTHFLQFYTSALLVSILLSIYLFVRSRSASDDDRAPAGNSGYVIYDFFMGRELNPRIKNFDIKFFCEMRPGLIGWLVFNFAMLLAEMKLQSLDTPSSAMLLVNGFQLVWVADGLWHEEKLLTMMDILHDGFGFMLAFGDLAWVPFTFTCQSYYLASHPSDLPVFWIVAIILMNAIGYYIFRKANSQKFAFRRNPFDPTLSHLKTIPTATGKSLIASGLWGFVRHPNYLGDILMALAWSLTCGFNHVIPYFYLIYLIILLVHREARDEHQCRKKYGLAWEKYCEAVPYRIFPGVY
ncbi:delta(14)-sterol reductase LBR isoform X1 [Pangasianodon hypophthalmus]|uniref:delta(14)-sterol reductase LBR isoform X1 n=1 Tax=Pangasianodon hypophthalmus TaxID=310915 RepID=UPI000EFF380F|nr:delta(14)-sterol reductase LBR isoform X1 [Pangasianodon hypophthalmus]XP_026802773.3 delta(14)-sterol reductase LBR isoform X1 [Pangasianodon hypophthalmus]